jgi:hypothetical protein
MLAVLAVTSELLSANLNSLIHGKIQGISSISGPWRLLGPQQSQSIGGEIPYSTKQGI